MGKIYKSTVASGTSGSTQLALENTTAPILNDPELKIKEMQDKMARVLEEKGIKKYSKDKLLFVVKDRSGQIIFLEEGNESAGYRHILNKHSKHFFDKHNIPKENLKRHIQNIIEYGKVISNTRRLENGREVGYNRVYLYKGKYYSAAGIGSNGFLVTIFPVKGVKNEKN